jgi:hypothetical protein
VADRTPEEHRKIVRDQREVQSENKDRKKSVAVSETTIPGNNGTRIKVLPGTKGSINEYLATVWLMKEGYDVFKNASPIGRADLIAVDWNEGEWLAVDVKSAGYNPNGDGILGEAQKKQADEYRSSNIKYLIVADDGSCSWYKNDGLVADNDNDDMWTDPSTKQRFRHPRHDMSRRGWSFFGYWALKHHRDKLNDGQAEMARVAWQSTMGRGRILTQSERSKLMRVHMDLYQKIIGVDVEGRGDFDAAA